MEKTVLETAEIHLAYVPLVDINVAETPHHFRLETPFSATEALAASLTRSGQAHPAILIENESGGFQILDGHRRLAAMAHIQETGGAWEKIWAQVFPADALSPLQRFRLVREHNFLGENPYGLIETGRFLRFFLRSGVALETVAQEMELRPDEVDDMSELGSVDAFLASLLNNGPFPASYAVLLHRRFEACLRSLWAMHAASLAIEMLKQANPPSLSPISWQFLLDFYWGTKRPFLPRVRRP